MSAAALFSGGKESLYAMYLAEKQGVNVEHLICLIHNSEKPSPHVENMEALGVLAESIKKAFTVVDIHKGKESFAETLQKLEVDFLVGGDVLVEQHISYLEKVCRRAGVDLMEPLFGRKTSQLFQEILDSGFEPLIICVDTRYLGEEWLGFTLNPETASTFLTENKEVDPCGENGEYHTLVVSSPLYSKSFQITSSKKNVTKNVKYLTVSLL